MPSPYGTGYGAGKIFEGITSGALRGKLYNDEKQAAAATAAENTDLKNRQLGLQERGLDLQEKRLLNDQQVAEIKRRSDAFSTAFEAGTKAPPGQEKSVFDSSYKSLYPEGEVPNVEFGAETKVTLADGSVIKGQAESIKQLTRLMSLAPEKADEHMKTAIEAGVVQFEKFGTDKKTNLAKLIDERKALVDQGVPEDDPRVQAYDSKISGQDIDMAELSDDQYEVLGAYYNATGRMPNVGRGKQATKARMRIIDSATRQALGTGTEGKSPVQAALDVVGTQTDTKAIQGSVNFLDKQLSSMGSFVVNINNQIDRVGTLAKDLQTFDTRLLNIPIRKLRGRLAGSALQAKYDLYLTEIENEIGKLATGSTASVAELSQGAQEKWAMIHDKNLSTADMLELLDETRHAANIRIDSVRETLKSTRERIRSQNREYVPPKGARLESDQQTQRQAPTGQAPQAAIDYLRQNPGLKEQFRTKYGYIPEGL